MGSSPDERLLERKRLTPQHGFESRFTARRLQIRSMCYCSGPFIGRWQRGPRSAYAVNMPKQQKVVPIRKQASSPSDSGPENVRILVSIGGRRFAIDFLTRISSLASATVDRTVDILPIKGVTSDGPFASRRVAI